MTEIVYSTHAVPLAEGQTFRNARFFASPEPGVERVHVHGEWPGIVSAYHVAGVEVVVNGVTKPAQPQEVGEFGPLAQAFVPEELPSLEPIVIAKARRRK